MDDEQPRGDDVFSDDEGESNAVTRDTKGTWKRIQMRPKRDPSPDERAVTGLVVDLARLWKERGDGLSEVLRLTTGRDRQIAMTWAEGDDYDLICALMDASIRAADEQIGDVYINGLRLTQAMIAEQHILVEYDGDGVATKVTFPVRYENGRPIYTTTVETELGTMREPNLAPVTNIADYLR